MKKSLLFFLFFVFSVSSLLAQVTTSSITGSVKDAQGEALIGATVKATHVPTGTNYGVSTNVQGQFTIANVRAGGPYRIDVSYVGFQPRTFTNITLRLGEPYVLEVQLSQSGQLEEVVVSAEASRLNTNRTGASTNVNTAQLNNLPTITRSLEDFTRLTPQANGVGFAGRDNRFNNLQVDGANFNNAFGTSSSDLLPGGATRPISLDAIEELQINIAPYDVRQSGFTGAGINAVTRSGSNQFSGSAYIFYRNQDLRGTRISGERVPNPDNSTRSYGFRLGGPVIKNKLFFFANYENENEIFPGINWIASRPGLTGNNVARTTAADLERVRTHLINTYNYDPGAYENYANEFNNKSDRFLARLDWNINNNHKFTTRFNYAEGTSDDVVNGNSGPNPRSSSNRVSSNSLAFSNSNFSYLNKIASVTAELNSTLSSRLSNQLLATYSHSQATRSTPGSPFPFVDIWNGNSNYMSFGTELFSGANDLINDNYTFIDNLTYTAGRHTFTGGLSYEQIRYKNLYQRMATSYYRYASVDDFINNAQPTSYGITYAYQGQDPYVQINFGIAGAYFQDRLAVTDNFDLTVGLRAELPLYLNDLDANPAIDNLELLDVNGIQTKYYPSGQWPKSKVILSPRVGFNYNVFGDGSLKLRGGTGIFAGRVPFVWLTNMPGGTGLIQNQLEPVGSDVLPGIRFNPDPMYWVNNGPSNVFLKTPSSGTPSSISLVHPDFKMPKIWRSSFGADYLIPGTPLVATTDLLYSKDINAIYQFNANRRPAPMQMNYSGDRRDFWNGSANSRYNAGTGNTTAVLANTNKGYSFSGTIGLSIPQRKGLSGGIYYTYTDARDVSGNPGSSASSAWANNYSINDPNEQLLGISQYSIPHRIVGNISYRREYVKHLATTVSLFYDGANQGRFAYTTGGDLNRDGVSLDLLYIPRSANELTFAPILGSNNAVLFTEAQQREAFERFVNNSKALSDSRGDYVLRNSGLMPWLNRFDFRLLQDVFTNVAGRRNTLQLSFDIQNVGNLINSNWAVPDLLTTGAPNQNYNYPLLNVTNVSATGVPTFQMVTTTINGQTVLPERPFRDYSSVTSAWRMQLGLRYTF
ncbi:TonB-dependent receptor [Pedobacter sp. SYSU D00535]|uniref:TonB-dependent receptor n=1 Tax=Pedobacter sp. SYSU D00535 TaxID=2810308 RepID=UPI001A95A123|nr:TonB-dependent receptor [Pedobacter sp. SYSU D00535]